MYIPVFQYVLISMFLYCFCIFVVQISTNAPVALVRTEGYVLTTMASTTVAVVLHSKGFTVTLVSADLLHLCVCVVN